MITYKKGDLFTTPDTYIVHGCNAEGVMGSGVAKIVKEKYPQAFQDYYEYCQLRDSNYLLGFIKPSTQPDGKVIINAITQLGYGHRGGRFVSYDAVDDCMLAVQGFLKITQQPTPSNISMPKIGAGLGGGNWDIIEQIIKSHLWMHNVTVWEL